ncbi:MAG TPA: VCBS repeat-containing protein, partial [Anseongella sp.]|nr:VCBS repeat-containing protein [Anseongella sp.]
MKTNSIALLGLLGLCFTGAGPALAQDGQTGPVRFLKKQIGSESYESAGIFDVNGDKQPDIVSGAYWYEGPKFIAKHYIGAVKAYGEYWDDFSTIPMDVNADGRMDYITGSWFSNSIRWHENPGKEEEWKQHIIGETGNVECTMGWDVDNDGHIEIVPNNPGHPLKFYKLQRDAAGKSTGTFVKTEVAANQGHGLGFGDVNGDGRGDFIVSDGWLEAPADPLKGKWTMHKEFEFGGASVPILVVDVNSDG